MSDDAVLDALENSPAMEAVFAWTRRSGPDYTKREIAAMFLESLKELDRKLCPLCKSENVIVLRLSGARSAHKCQDCCIIFDSFVNPEVLA